MKKFLISTAVIVAASGAAYAQPGLIGGTGTATLTFTADVASYNPNASPADITWSVLLEVDAVYGSDTTISSFLTSFEASLSGALATSALVPSTQASAWANALIGIDFGTATGSDIIGVQLATQAAGNGEFVGTTLDLGTFTTSVDGSEIGNTLTFDAFQDLRPDVSAANGIGGVGQPGQVNQFPTLIVNSDAVNIVPTPGAAALAGVAGLATLRRRRG